MNYKNIVLAWLLLGGMWVSQYARADSIIELGVHFGGDEIVRRPDQNGHQDSIKAGERFSFDFGRLYHLSNSWETQLTFGIKSDAKYDKDKELSWVRYPLSGLLFYRMSAMRVGLGATYHFYPKLQGKGIAGNVGEKYEGAFGGLMEMDFIRSSKFLWGIRLTYIKYEAVQDRYTVNGSSIGFLIIAQL